MTEILPPRDYVVAEQGDDELDFLVGLGLTPEHAKRCVTGGMSVDAVTFAHDDFVWDMAYAKSA